MPNSRTARLLAFVDRHRWPIFLFIAALVVRLHWNLQVHPIGEFLYSDMKGYAQRGDGLITNPLGKSEYGAFFPFGTSWLIGAIRFLFGRDSWTPVGVVFALMGALTVSFGWAIALRLVRRPYVAHAVGVVGVIYYPLIALGGYTLSELPFAFALTVSVWVLLRLIDHGRARDAWLLGIWVSAATVCRPQVLLGVVGVAIYYLCFRKSLPNLTIKRLFQASFPLLLVLGLSAVRVHYHTGRWGIVSENGPINLMFGRCHNKGVATLPDGKGHGNVRFAPPPLIQLESHSKKNPDSWVQIAPVFGEWTDPVDVPKFAIDKKGCAKRGCKIPGAEIEYAGYIGDGKIQNHIVRECMRRSGFRRQAYFGVVHVIQLWGYAVMWPDQANPRPRPVDEQERWRALGERWKKIHNWLFLGPCLLALPSAFSRRNPARAMVAVQVWSLIIVTFIYIGGIRFRAPYDPLILALAASSWEEIGEWISKRVARWRGRPNTTV